MSPGGFESLLLFARKLVTASRTRDVRTIEVVTPDNRTEDFEFIKVETGHWVDAGGPKHLIRVAVGRGHKEVFRVSSTVRGPGNFDDTKLELRPGWEHREGPLELDMPAAASNEETRITKVTPKNVVHTREVSLIRVTFDEPRSRASIRQLLVQHQGDVQAVANAYF